jgi:hypothetical protein
MPGVTPSFEVAAGICVRNIDGGAWNPSITAAFSPGEMLLMGVGMIPLENADELVDVPQGGAPLTFGGAGPACRHKRQCWKGVGNEMGSATIGVRQVAEAECERRNPLDGQVHINDKLDLHVTTNASSRSSIRHAA